MTPTPGRILVWFSCGAASAVAAKVAVMRYAKERTVEVCYCNTSADEHPDNARFMADVERWTGQSVKVLSHPKYTTVEDCWRGESYVAGIAGASCTKRMKRELREKYQRPDDTHVFGLTADEAGRISDFEKFHPDLNCLWLLATGRITKESCYHVLSAAGIELPAMYRLGYSNNNCRGCCKGGQGYFNKVRRDFPEVFAARARAFREIGFNPFSRPDGTRFGLDDLDPDAGRDVPEPPIECGLFCGHYSALLDNAVGKAGAA